MYHNDASTELTLRGFSVVGEAIRKHSFRNGTCPLDKNIVSLVQSAVDIHKPRSAMNVSRPQSPNQGYPAIMVFPSPRFFSRQACSFLRSEP